MSVLSIRLFGDFAVLDEHGVELPLGDKRSQALLIYLALKLGSSPSLAEFGRLYFGETPSATSDARTTAEELQYALRRFPGDPLIDDGAEVRLDPEQVDVDTHRFSELVAAPSINSIRKAADIYQGNLCERFFAAPREFNAWLADRRLSYWRGALVIFGNLLTTQIRAGWWEEAVETASRLLSLDPSQEVVHRTLMRLQLDQGRADAAMRRYQECADILQRDYGRAPSPETERLRAEISKALARTPAPREVLRTRPDRPVLVLLVEDDLVSAALVEAYLADAGYDVVTVVDGGEALLELGRREFDVLILDINIPTLSGLKVFEIMIQKQIDTPAIFITGMSGTDVEAQSLEMGAAGFLRKPIRRDVLLPKIRGILQRKQKANAQAQS